MIGWIKREYACRDGVRRASPLSIMTGLAESGASASLQDSTLRTSAMPIVVDTRFR